MKNGQKEMGNMLWIPGRFNCGPPFLLGSMFGEENYLMVYPDYLKKLFRYYGEEAYSYNQVIAKSTIEENLTPI